MDSILLFKDRWKPITEELKRKLDIDTQWLPSPNYASEIIVELILDKTLDRDTLVRQKFVDVVEAANCSDVEEIYMCCRKMADLCQVMDYGPAGVWLGMFCEEVLEKNNDAQYWYNKAACFGDGIGMYRVGLLYLNQKVSIPATTSLRRCFTDAVANGVPEAQIIIDKYF